MPPKAAKKPQPKAQAKSKKQSEDEDFDKILSELKKATKSVGLEKQKQQQQEERSRAEKEKKHNAILEKRKQNDVEQALLMRQRQMEFQQILQQLMQAQRTFLDAPDTNVRTETDASNPHFDAAVAEMQGWRANMEDAHAIEVDHKGGEEGIFCVFDGHSGKNSADACKANFPTIIRSHTGADNAIDFETAFLEMDAKLREEVKDDSGCTAVVVHVDKTRVACGWVGDSRAVLCRGGEAFALSEDHKPELEAEEARITAAGGFVQDNRVNAQLAMSRAMGDFKYKQQSEKSPKEQLVIAVPGVISTPRHKDDSFVVLACDGIFDVMTNRELIDFIVAKKNGKEKMDNKAICEAVCRQCLAPPSVEAPKQPARAEGTDNMTVLIVDLKSH